ncbi:MAG: DNA polymerase III subunit beta family protein [Blastococcus sp.]
MRGIGQMARECGLTVSALRFYDGAGVLVPAHVDPRSNYRWYSDDQVTTARLVARLRRVGLPLADICRVLENRRSRPVVDEILQAHLTRLEDGLADARRELSAAVSLLDMALLDEESPMTTTRITTTAEELGEALRAVRYAVGTDTALPMLTGVLLDADGASFRVVATDRYRLAVSTVAGAEIDGGPVSVIAPVAMVDEVLGALGGGGPVAVVVRGNDLAVEVAGRSVTAQRLDHDFPDYRRFLPGAPVHRVGVDVAVLRARLGSAPQREVRNEESGTTAVATVLTLGADGELHCTDDVPGVLEIGLDREFLLDALDAGGAGQLVLELDGPITPLAIRNPDRLDDVSLLMPIRLT